MKSIKITIIIIIAFLLIAGVVKDLVLKSVIEAAASNIIGASVKVNGFSLGMLNQSVRISGLRLYNPKGFEEGVLADIPKIYVNYDLGSLMARKIHVKKVAFDLKEVVVIKNNEGMLNVDSLKVSKGKKQGPKNISKNDTKMPLRIDEAILSIGNVVYKDYTKGEKPVVESFDIGIKEKKYVNIKSAEELAVLILVEAIKGTTIKGAMIYGAATIAGTALLPVGVGALLTSKDSVEEEFSFNYDKIYDISLAVLKEMGDITGEDKANGIIKGSVNGNNVAIKLIKIGGTKTRIVISARQAMIPKPKIAGGVLYEISNKLK